jgi:hypothetical protein
MVTRNVPLHLVPEAQKSSVEPSDIASTTVLRGDLSAVTILEVIQLMCAQGQSWTVSLLDQGVAAEASVSGGELVDARYDKLSGQDALVELIALRQGKFEVRSHNGNVPHTIHGRWQQVLIAAVQQLDERMSTQRSENTRSLVAPTTHHSRRRKSGKFHSDELARTRPSPTPSNPPDTVKEAIMVSPNAAEAPELIDRGFAALRAGNVNEARAHWTHALELDPGNRALRFNLKKLNSK